jgi:uncharacterized protein YbjT (DUF2867 family)
MKIFLTGATGFIGGAVALALQERGDEVRALVRNREKALPRGLVDTKVCAIDETWSGLRLTERRS